MFHNYCKQNHGTFPTWLPSFCQKTAGGGFPLVPQRKVTVRPGVVIWSRGRTTIWGGTATHNSEKKKCWNPVIMCHYFINMWLKYRHWKNEFITLIHKSYSNSRHLTKVLHGLLKNYNNFYTQPPIFININLNVNTPEGYTWSLEPTDFTKCCVSCLEPWVAFTVATCLLLVCGSFCIWFCI